MRGRAEILQYLLKMQAVRAQVPKYHVSQACWSTSLCHSSDIDLWNIVVWFFVESRSISQMGLSHKSTPNCADDADAGTLGRMRAITLTWRLKGTSYASIFFYRKLPGQGLPKALNPGTVFKSHRASYSGWRSIPQLRGFGSSGRYFEESQKLLRPRHAVLASGRDLTSEKSCFKDRFQAGRLQVGNLSRGLYESYVASLSLQ